AADQLDAALPPVEYEIEVPGHVAEIVEERRRPRIEGPEDHALVALDASDWMKAPSPLVEVAVALLVGHADQRAAHVVRPAVVGAGERLGVAEVRATDLHSAVAAGVEKRLHRSIPLAD